MGAIYDRGPRRLAAGLMLLAVALAAAGALVDSLWLLGFGAWALIVAVLIELLR
ncbi:hypothetical protein [Streptomyces gobitricini]|uniref:Phosphatidate cytidylyltransferase n=1 Tax=Streptomyces gobitricini TaxID=68211 RepID=A0ABN3MGU8_9ACTN